MCLAIPAQILDIDAAGANATVSVGGVRRPISLALIDGAAVGDYVLVHVGYALNRISPEEAERTLALIREAGELLEAEFGGEAGDEIDDPIDDPIEDEIDDEVDDKLATTPHPQAPEAQP